MSDPQLWTVIAAFSTLFLAMMGMTTTLLLRVVQHSIDASTQTLRGEMHLMRSDLTAEMHLMRSDLTAEINSVRTDLTAEINSVRTDLTAEINSVRTELKGDFHSLKTEVSDLRTEFAVRFEALDRHLPHPG